MQRLALIFADLILRAIVLVTCTGIGAVAAVIADRPFAPRSSPDWGFGRLGVELLAGGVVGLVIGFTLAVRVGRHRLDRATRVLRCLAVLAIAALLLLGSYLES